MGNIKKLLAKSLIIACLIYMGLINILNGIVFIKNKIYLYTFPVFIIFIIVLIAVRYIKIRPVYFAISVFLIAFTLKSIVAIFYNVPPSSDFSNFYNAALKVANGDFSFSSSGYFKLWAYQTGIVIYYATLIKVFGSSILALKIVNCLFIAGVNVILYLILKKLLSEKIAMTISLLYLFYPATFFLASVLTNQHISNFLILLGIYILISRQEKNIWNGIFPSAFLIALGNAMRPQAIVVVTAIVIYTFFEIITSFKDIKKIKQLITSIFCFQDLCSCCK